MSNIPSGINAGAFLTLALAQKFFATTTYVSNSISAAFSGVATFAGNLFADNIPYVQDQHIRFVETGGLGTNSTDLVPAPAAQHFDLTNLSNNNKHGLTGIAYTTSSTGTISTNLIALSIYTPPDNGGDTSGVYVSQTGGGNAISAYNFSEYRPSGYTEYKDTGVAVETGVDGNKTCHFVSLFGTDGPYGIKLYMGDTAGMGTGITVFPSADSQLSRRAFRVSNALNTQENCWVDLSGNVYYRGTLTVDGNVSLNSPIIAQVNVSTASSLPLIINNSSGSGGGTYLVVQYDTSTKAILGWTSGTGIDLQDNVNGNSWLKQISGVSGSIRGVKNIFDDGSGNAAFAGTLTATGHLLSNGTALNGTLQNNSAVAGHASYIIGSGTASGTVVGNDQRGVLNVTLSSVGYTVDNDLLSVYYTTPYASAPSVTISYQQYNGGGAPLYGIPYIGVCVADHFTVRLPTSATVSQSFAIQYVVIG